VIKTQSVKAKLIEPGYGFIRITQFQEHTGEDLAKAIRKLYTENQSALKGLVLDLRNDPGGLLNAAVGVSGVFLPKNSLVVYTDGRTEDSKMRLYSVPESYVRGGEDYLAELPAGIKNVPMVVLINGGSASASEIVAGALQDHKRAAVMGTQSFGKGSVQTILPLGGNGAIKLTTARYFTPNGRSIQAKGITPDIAVEDPNSDGTGRVREADLQRHLGNPNGSEEKKPETPKPADAAAPVAPSNPLKTTPPQAPVEFGSPGDALMGQAVNLLKGVAIIKP
jgi:carboxyl-terminal processing protease